MAKKARKLRNDAPAVVSASVAEPERPPVLFEFLGRHARAIAVAAVLLASARIVATYTVFNHTLDEPAHIGAGMEWLDRKTYTWERQHPPLARVASALGPYLLGARSVQPPKMDDIDKLLTEGTQILYRGHRYDRLLATARLGILPFFWVACFVVFEWGRRSFDRATAAIAVVFFSFLPPVLAHAGLATTDMALTAWLSAAFLAAILWVQRPDWKRSVLFGACTGLAVISKFSSLAFLPATLALAAAVWLWRERPTAAVLVRDARGRAVMFLVAAAAACIVIWAGYRFSFGKVYFADLRLPAPELYQGVKSVLDHNRGGHSSYLLGERSQTGFWYFFPVVLGVKTPLAFLALVGLGIVLVVRRRDGFRQGWLPLAFSAAILAVGMIGNIDIGLRHVLPVYVGFALVAAIGAADLLRLAPRKAWATPVLGLAVAWLFASSLLSHPDYLPYFNELAGSEPEKIVVDSDLDWGQDVKRLARRLQQVGAREVTFLSLLTADYREHGMPRVIGVMDGLRPPPGWCAISITYLKARRLGSPDPNRVLWPDRIPPAEKVGAGIYLWQFPPAQ
jgi:hypothetical protein